MVVRDGGEKVMADMCVCNVMMEEVQNAKGPVYSRKCPPQPVPLLIAIVRKLGVRVLQQSDHHQPVVDNQIWQNIHLSQWHCKSLSAWCA